MITLQQLISSQEKIINETEIMFKLQANYFSSRDDHDLTLLRNQSNKVKALISEYKKDKAKRR